MVRVEDFDVDVLNSLAILDSTQIAHSMIVFAAIWVYLGTSSSSFFFDRLYLGLSTWCF